MAPRVNASLTNGFRLLAEISSGAGLKVACAFETDVVAVVGFWVGLGVGLGADFCGGFGVDFGVGFGLGLTATTGLITGALGLGLVCDTGLTGAGLGAEGFAGNGFAGCLVTAMALAQTVSEVPSI